MAQRLSGRELMLSRRKIEAREQLKSRMTTHAQRAVNAAESLADAIAVSAPGTQYLLPTFAACA
jgi:hypothetical protein